MNRVIKFLPVKPSFSEGLSRIADIGGTRRDEYIVFYSKRIHKAESMRSKWSSLDDTISKEFASDWKAVARDLTNVTKRLSAKYSLPNPQPRYARREKDDSRPQPGRLWQDVVSKEYPQN